MSVLIITFIISCCVYGSYLLIRGKNPLTSKPKANDEDIHIYVASIDTIINATCVVEGDRYACTYEGITMYGATVKDAAMLMANYLNQYLIEDIINTHDAYNMTKGDD